MKTYRKFRGGNYTGATEYRFWIGIQNLENHLILSAKMKFFRKKNNLKKINNPSNFVLQIEMSKVSVQRKKYFQKNMHLIHILSRVSARKGAF